MEKLKVDTAVISKQNKTCENYEKFKEIVKEKKIKIIVVSAQISKKDTIQFDKDTKIKILWPEEEQIKENILNNNSIVCKLYYKKFTMLFTGDIEEIAEKRILSEYKNNLKMFNCTVLKVAHHGSKTSSTENFLNVVKPKFAVIGVGKNNLFGHPNSEVIKRLENIRCKNF